MGKLKDHNCCPYCGGKLIDHDDHDKCMSCGWKTKIPRASLVGHDIQSIQPGGIFEGKSGTYERTYEGTWMCVVSRVVFTDSELYVEESRCD